MAARRQSLLEMEAGADGRGTAPYVQEQGTSCVPVLPHTVSSQEVAPSQKSRPRVNREPSDDTSLDELGATSTQKTEKCISQSCTLPQSLCHCLHSSGDFLPKWIHFCLLKRHGLCWSLFSHPLSWVKSLKKCLGTQDTRQPVLFGYPQSTGKGIPESHSQNQYLLAQWGMVSALIETLCLLITIGGRLWWLTDVPRTPLEQSENRAPTSSDKLLIFLTLCYPEMILSFATAPPAFPVWKPLCSH